MLDLQFSLHDPSLIGVALSDALVSFYRIESSADGQGSDVSIKFVNSIVVHEDVSQLSLFLAWLPPPTEGEDDGFSDGFAVPFSDGQVSIFKRKRSSTGFQRESFMETRLGDFPIEVWFLAFHRKIQGDNKQLTLYSGDDLSQLRGMSLDDMPSDENGEEEREDPVMRSWQFNDRGKQHTAGVTSILPLCNDENGAILLTGSYDQFVRIYHHGSRGSVLASMDIGGGVWRLKLIEAMSAENTMTIQNDGRKIIRSYTILASCMHGGARIIRVTNYMHPDQNSSLWDIGVLLEFTEHTSMNYASDFWPGKEREAKTENRSSLLCVTSSFYDKRVCVWRADVK